MKKYVNQDFDPNYTCCENQYSSPANDLINSKAALAKPYFGANPDGVMSDQAGKTWTKMMMQRPDEIIDEANFMTREEDANYKRYGLNSKKNKKGK